MSTRSAVRLGFASGVLLGALAIAALVLYGPGASLLVIAAGFAGTAESLAILHHHDARKTTCR